MRRWVLGLIVLPAVGLVAALAGCDDGPPGPERTLSILSGSENRSLEPIITAFCDDQGWACPMTYLGSVDIRLALQDGTIAQDAVWPAHSRWVELGDRSRRVKHLRSIMQSPVVFAVREDEAAELNLVDRPVTTRELVDLVRAGELQFIMTSATQSNSGFSAYLAMLTALAGSPEVLTTDMLDEPALADDMSTLLSGVERTSGSSGWLAELYLEGSQTGAYQAMFNYEALVIETNRVLEEHGRPTLHAIYPADGVALADSPLGFVSGGREPDVEVSKEAFFEELQNYLLSDEVQRQLLALGRRTGFGGVVEGADADVFRPEWGIDVTAVLPAIRFPAPETIDRALQLYQETWRKPSLLALCLDFSGSMEGQGEHDVKQAIDLLFDRETSQRFLLQASQRDVFLVLPFSSRPWDVARAEGPEEAEMLSKYVSVLRAAGGTDMYACATAALTEMLSLPEFRTHNAAIILMTDGRSEGDRDGFARTYGEGGHDVPIYAITFGDADVTQLQDLAAMSRARVFDGRSDLTRAFRQARGYN